MKELDCKESKQCAWARYHEDTRTLEIDFKGKDTPKASTYEYAGVPLAIWEEFCASESKGRYFALHIRNQFKSRKIFPLPKE